jgi:hypothetical protein
LARSTKGVKRIEWTFGLCEAAKVLAKKKEKQTAQHELLQTLKLHGQYSGPVAQFSTIVYSDSKYVFDGVTMSLMDLLICDGDQLRVNRKLLLDAENVYGGVGVEERSGKAVILLVKGDWDDKK